MLDDGAEAGVWLASNQKSYDLTYTRDVTGTRGRLHHIAFFVDQREDVLRAADIFLEHGIVMESGPHKHAIQQTFFLYTYEPGGNRDRGLRGRLPDLRPRSRAGRVDAGRAREGPGLGDADRRLVPHQGDASRARGGRASCPQRRPLSRRPARASSCAAPTTCTSTSSPTWRSGASTTSRSRAASRELGLAGFVLKSHYVPTAERAAVVRAAVPGVDALGAIALNAGVGGLNAQAVEIAARGGARIVWLPTVDAENEASEDGPKPAKQPVWRKIQDEFAAAGVASEPVRLTRERPRARARGRRAPRPRARDGPPRPRRDPRRRSTRRSQPGVADVVVTHPDYPTQGVPVDEQLALAARGALLERCFAPIHTGKVSWEQTFEAIRATGAHNNVLSTDLGQVANPPVEDGLALMADRLLEAGFSEDEVHTMAVVNTRRLAGA